VLWREDIVYIPCGLRNKVRSEIGFCVSTDQLAVRFSISLRGVGSCFGRAPVLISWLMCFVTCVWTCLVVSRNGIFSFACK
jgi:hypothetical protein